MRYKLTDTIVMSSSSHDRLDTSLTVTVIRGHSAGIAVNCGVEAHE
jgi:hypothetical protein